MKKKEELTRKKMLFELDDAFGAREGEIKCGYAVLFPERKGELSGHFLEAQENARQAHQAIRQLVEERPRVAEEEVVAMYDKSIGVMGEGKGVAVLIEWLRSKGIEIEDEK